MKIKISKPHDMEDQRRVRRADNCIQFYIEELCHSGKIRTWKIAKVFYDMISAEKYILKQKDTHEAHQRFR